MIVYAAIGDVHNSKHKRCDCCQESMRQCIDLLYNQNLQCKRVEVNCVQIPGILD